MHKENFPVFWALIFLNDFEPKLINIFLTFSFSTEKQNYSHCVGCGGQILDQYILQVAPDLEWHAACLKCQECRQFLDESCTCFVRDGKTYCKRDYVRLFGTKCDKCGCSFSKNDFVMRAKSKIFHLECFRCTACSRNLIPGEFFHHFVSLRKSWMIQFHRRWICTARWQHLILQNGQRRTW